MPTPIGVYPAGDGPYGHCDLAGNVWEWSADKWDDVINHDDDRRFGPAIVIRGGAQDKLTLCLRAAYRRRIRAMDRNGIIGFRIAAASWLKP